MSALAALPGGTDTNAGGINTAGQIAGRRNFGGGTNNHAVLWSPNGDILDLGTLPGGAFSGANGLNDAGEVVGTSALGSLPSFNAIRWTSTGGMEDLGRPAGASFSNALGLNNSGQIVGFYNLGGVQTAVLWTPSGEMHDLKSLIDSSANGWSLNMATGINDVGQIIGRGIFPGSNLTHGFILSPVPEPSTLILIVLATLGLACVALRRRKKVT